MNADSRALFHALLTLFKLLMSVFMEKTTPKGNANSSLPSSQTPEEDTALARPATRGKGPAHNDARAANTRTVEHVERIAVEHCERCGEDLRPHRKPHHRATHPHRHRLREDPHPPRCRAQALPALPHRHPRSLPHRHERPHPVRRRTQSLRRAPARRPDALAQARRTDRAHPHRALPVRDHAAAVHLPTPSRPRRVGAPRHRAPARHARHPRRRDLVARQRQEPLDTRLLRRAHHPQTPPPQARARGHRGHRHHPALRRRGHPRLLGLLPELRPLRPRPVRCAPVARAHLHHRRP